MANKKTVVQMYEELLAIPTLTEEQKSFLAKRIEITKKKNANKSGELTPKQKEALEARQAVANSIVGVMVANTKYTPTELVKLLNNADIVSTQKMTPYLTDLVAEGRLAKVTEKGRNYYTLVVAEEADTD